jgi:predicted phage terminase large subunit-like protein
VRGQWGATNREKVIDETIAYDHLSAVPPATWLEREGGSGGIESAEATILRLAGYNVQAERPTGDKVLRARPLASMASSGKVRLRAGAWNHDFLHEIQFFPRGRYKDQVDAASGAFNKLTLGPQTGGPVVVGGRSNAPSGGLIGPRR